MKLDQARTKTRMKLDQTRLKALRLDQMRLKAPRLDQTRLMIMLQPVRMMMMLGPSDPPAETGNKGRSGPSDPPAETGNKGRSGPSDPPAEIRDKGWSGPSDPPAETRDEGWTGPLDPPAEAITKPAGMESSGRHEGNGCCAEHWPCSDSTDTELFSEGCLIFRASGEALECRTVPEAAKARETS
uniref:Uncharacterized protein n=1 Tax=Astatotilapia calliptera TaxID=8154 RepID=A0AAX7UFQ0_ASTCA